MDVVYSKRCLGFGSIGGFYPDKMFRTVKGYGLVICALRRAIISITLPVSLLNF